MGYVRLQPFIFPLRIRYEGYWLSNKVIYVKSMPLARRIIIIVGKVYHVLRSFERDNDRISWPEDVTVSCDRRSQHS